MGNIIFSMACPPDKHREVVSNINTWKYPVEGKYFVGSQAPFITEVKMYEVRMPTYHEPLFTRDMRLGDLFSPEGISVRNWKISLLNYIANFFRLFTPFQPLKPQTPGKDQYTFSGWHYARALGRVERPCVTNDIGTKREVL